MHSKKTKKKLKVLNQSKPSGSDTPGKRSTTLSNSSSNVWKTLLGMVYKKILKQLGFIFSRFRNMPF